jgi:hypothetical protein
MPSSAKTVAWASCSASGVTSPPEKSRESATLEMPAFSQLMPESSASAKTTICRPVVSGGGAAQAMPSAGPPPGNGLGDNRGSITAPPCQTP